MIDLHTDEVLLQNRYDGLSRRRERVQLEAGALVTNRYVYDPAGGGAGGWLVLAVLDGENEVLEQYVHGMDLSGSREGAGGIGGILAVSQSGTTNYFHYDGNGNVASTTDSEGAISARYEYDPFGRVLLSEGDYTPRYQFSSKEYDEATGLNYYGYRFYNPDLGRWLNRDPIGERGGLNLYALLYNSPVNHTDYLGMFGPVHPGRGGISEIEEALKDKHKNRNENNSCPQDEPEPGEEDCKGNTWARDNPVGEELYHGGLSCYRSGQNQCCYGGDGEVVDEGPYQGTYDYGAFDPDTGDGRIWHGIVDVLPHEVYGDEYADNLTDVYECPCE